MRSLCLFLLFLACSAPPPLGGTGAGGGGAGGGTGGGFHPGQSCTGDLNCADPNTGLFCECRGGVGECALTGKRFASYACKGVMGCHVNGALAFCDFSGAAPGDPCPVHETDLAICKADIPDGGIFLQCTDAGFWSGTLCARRCYESSGRVFCE